jgi:pimeloyl-ACP methyl ester carboxylesterase
MAQTAGAITFVVPGQDETQGSATRGAAGAAPSPGLLGGTVVHSVRVFSQRAGGGDVEVTATPEQDVVALHLTNGPTLYLHAESARDLFLAQTPDSAARGAAEADPGKIRIPAQLAWRRLEQAGATRGATRGLFGDALLKFVEVIREPAAKLVAKEVVTHVDDQVDEGVYQLEADRLDALKGGQRIASIPGSGEEPILVFIHGTFSTTKGTFDKLWAQHPQRVQQLFEHYKNRVYALDHRTLGASPIENALTLAKALPKGTPIHLVTHSRGGLVAEVLARACGTAPVKPADLEELFPGEDYEQQRRDLAELAERAEGLRVSRVVRVACPARGTLLASKRLDAYLSVFKWALELARIPVAPQIVEFLAAVAQRRTEPKEIAGLAAQIPDSPLVQWLHSPTERIAGELRVVAGDLAGDSLGSWVKVLLSDSFFRTDNDLVVQTSSMYGGTPRENGASFLFDQGGKVSHFSYFANELTARAVVDGLTNDVPAGFRTIGPLSWAGESATGERAPSTGADPSKPAVFVLPGILGSNLKQGEDRIWLAFRIVFGLTRLRYKPGGEDGIEPDGPVGRIYDDLVKYLSASHEVIEFPFDWRRPIEEEGRRLAKEVEQKLKDREQSKQPVRLIAHSMGGLVARAMQLEHPEVWERMLATDRARVLMLGTPNGGSWAPMQVLSGDDSFGNLLVGFGAPFKQGEARALMAAMPGFIQMQAKITDPALGLDRREKWEQLAEADAKLVREQPWWRHAEDMVIDEFRWGIPTQEALDQAVALRKRYDLQAGSAELVPAASKVLLVVGKADFTPDGYEFAEEKGLVYLDAQQAGDGRVTLENARLPKVPAWALDCEHGELPHDKRAFAAYAELLENGSTDKLPVLDAPARGALQVTAPVVHVRSRRARILLSPRPPETPADALSASERPARESAPAAGPVLEVSVLNANLAFVQLPLMIGHYRAERLTGTESVMDRLIGGKMQTALTLADYPSEPGTSRVFPNNRENPDDIQRMPRPSAVIVVGLGEEGDFRGSSLVESARKGAIAAAQWAARNPKNLPQFELAATLIGSGGPSISAGQAAQLVAQGVREANAALAQLGGECPVIGHLQFVELYLDRAAEALRALQTQAAASPALFRIREERVRPGAGALRRPLDAGYRGTSYDFISALADKPDGAAPGQVPIRYALDTRRARTEVRTQKPQSKLVQELVKVSARSALEDRELGKTLFRLLVPADLEPYLGGTTEMVIELNGQTAGIPWELMEAPDSGDSRPWAVRAKLLRKLRTESPPPRVPDAGKDAGILIIGEPRCDDPRYPRLPGARLEANAVLKRLTAAGKFAPERVRGLIAPEDAGRTGPAFDEVMKALMSGKWRVLHVSGHGAAPEGDRPSRGVVLSNGTFIGAAEIEALRPVPELVFVNCCHLGASSPSGVLDFSRPEFAASVAQALIAIGVRCVVAAGWAVDDAVATTFADTFYKRLLEGDRFMDAVFLAREEAHAQGGNTWAAYQCYGDPNWTLDIAGGDPQRPASPPGPEFAGVTSALALVVALETIATECQSRMPKFTPKEMERQRLKIRYLESLPATANWGKRGDVAEAFAKAWTQADDPQAGLGWYRKALDAPDGGASMKAIEQYENLRVRVAADKVDEARKASNPAALRSTAKAAAEEVRSAIRELEKLFQELPSMERANLCASANKRLAMILEACGDPDAEAVDGARRHYAAAEKLGEKLPDVFYPTMNIVALDVISRPKSVPADRFRAVRQKIRARLQDEPEFWSAVGDIELSLYEALNENALAPKLPVLNHSFDDLRERWPAPWMWKSVRDQVRFIFPRYAQRASADENAAAGALRAKLEAYAGETEPARQAPQPKAAPPKQPAAAAKPKKASGARNARRGRARRS